VAGFDPGTDALLFRGVDPAAVRAEAAARGGAGGLELRDGGPGDVVFLRGVAELAEGDILFA
jgi:hypothetical protein